MKNSLYEIVCDTNFSIYNLYCVIEINIKQVNSKISVKTLQKMVNGKAYINVVGVNIITSPATPELQNQTPAKPRAKRVSLYLKEINIFL